MSPVYFNRGSPIMVPGGVAMDERCCCNVCQWITWWVVNCETEQWEKLTYWDRVIPYAREPGYWPPAGIGGECAALVYGEMFDCTLPEEEWPEPPTMPQEYDPPSPSRIFFCCENPYHTCFVIHDAPIAGKWYLLRDMTYDENCENPSGDVATREKGEWWMYPFPWVDTATAGCWPIFSGINHEWWADPALHLSEYRIREMWGPYNGKQEFDARDAPDGDKVEAEYQCLTGNFVDHIGQAVKFGRKFWTGVELYPNRATCEAWCGSCCEIPAVPYMCVERAPIPPEPEDDLTDTIWRLRWWRGTSPKSGEPWPAHPCTTDIDGGSIYLDSDVCELWGGFAPETYDGVWYCVDSGEEPGDPCECEMAEKIGPFISWEQCAAYGLEPTRYCMPHDTETVDHYWDENGWRYTVMSIHDSQAECEAECLEEEAPL